ncbi:type IV toxin-antitoxin system AbiEi family antitoxin domain-containing protein [candidate division KSB1 bacterium]|nr:type IV toxin-antitoxin system AbiEi family antitoxin domain-containing protein [candidate division KSB1 bacterium]
MDQIISIFQKHGGYARMKDLKGASVQSQAIAQLVQDGVIEKIKPGLYRLAELPLINMIPISYIDVCKAIPNGVICLLSALEHFELTTFNPSEIYVALPHSSKPPKMYYPPVRSFYYRDRFYNYGINTIKTGQGNIQIYDKEKSICDMFRYRKKLGEDIALEALKNYLKQNDVNIQKLTKDAIHCQVKTIILPYLKAMVA